MEPVRAVISGIGVVSPFGVGREVFWDHIARGVSGTRAITAFDARSLACQVAAAVPDDALGAVGADGADIGDEADLNGRADPRRYAKVSRIAVLAAREALRDAKLEDHDGTLGVIVGSGAGGIDVAERQYGEFFSDKR